MGNELPTESKLKTKENAINKIINTIDTLDIYNKLTFIEHYKRLKPNNTFFMSYLRYRGDLNVLEK